MRKPQSLPVHQNRLAQYLAESLAARQRSVLSRILTSQLEFSGRRRPKVT